MEWYSDYGAFLCNGIVLGWRDQMIVIVVCAEVVGGVANAVSINIAAGVVVPVARAPVFRLSVKASRKHVDGVSSGVDS
jgi:hypothetical protein